MRAGLQLWREVEGRLITILGRGSPGEEADVSQPEVGSRVECVCVCVCVCMCVCQGGGGGLHLGTRQEMKTCSDQEQRLRTASSFLLRHQLSQD